MNMAISNIGRNGRKLKIKNTTGVWWPCEIQVLETMLDERKTISDIADVLDRLPSMVRQKIQILKKSGGRPRLSFRRTRGGWWDSEVIVLKSMIKDNYKVPYISEVLDRDANCVHVKIKYLRVKGEL
ncbi:hypothetical protein [Acinetobacter dispersus]|uniref:hypothetical protein n=1 Tax=Acinetobacter dispersus TaxID=70348 RepID=UPI00132EF369|nr:hypothetical protein [Acinetobacter dispersus]QHH99209.1 hypothetical protein FPL17_17340 [Acinetobacter dispersus]